MLNVQTLVVLGAGASVDFGLPLGEHLSSQIAHKLNIKFELGHKQISGDPEIMQALRLRAQREQCDVNLYREAGCNIAEGIGFSRSIDSYLSAHEDNGYVKTCGKLAIVQTILEAERGSTLWSDPSRANSTFQVPHKVMGSWLNDFMFLLINGMARAKNLEKVFDNLAIINFNYDRCIEQFFWLSLRQLFQIKETECAQLIRTKLKVLRPYGNVGEHPMGQEGVPFGAKLHPSQYEAIANGIRTFNEQVEDKDLIARVHEEVEQCDRVIFLGFHFHKQNMDFLTPERLTPLGVNVSPRQGYGTATKRSGPDVEVIESQIKRMFHGQILPSLDSNWDCKEIFRIFGTTWGM